MTDLEKDQAIYQAMCEIAQKYFNRAIESDEQFRKFMSEKTIISVKELKKDSNWYAARRDIVFDDEEITVDTFSCRFRGDNVFNLMQQFKSLAKAKGDYLFTYEEKVENKFIGTINVTFNNPTNAKNLAKYVGDEELRPVLMHVLMEVNTSSRDINFVSSDGQTLGIITSDKKNWWHTPEDEDANYQALFSAKDWKLICDHAKKNGSVKFELYKRLEGEYQDTMFAIVGDSRIRSYVDGQSVYPNWRKVLPKYVDNNFHILPEDIKTARNFIKSFKLGDSYEKVRQKVCVSFYRGSDIGYFDYEDLDFGINKTATFRLTKPSEKTCGVCYNIHRLQQLKFSGFHIQDASRATYIDTDSEDLLLLMPMQPDDEWKCTFNEEEREVVVEEVTAA